ncbi:MAG: DNA-processing protein DprA [Gammaproteobacteria bacterium]|nr:DNA-processing protein DprA [Gammaproteobacteria bacterium]
MTVPDPSAPAESEIPGWLAIGRTGSCNGHAVLRAVQTFGGVGALFDAGERDLAVLGFSPAAVERIRRVDWSAVRRDREFLDRIGVSIVPIGTGLYPSRLAAISSPPPVLYCRGNPEILDCPQIAVVGSRAATRGGRVRARTLAGELAACGLVITSGLARGIDAAAHRGALDAGGPSVAVLATGPDRIYPRLNAALARELLEAGTVVTERAPGTPPLPGNFPRRNRLISGLSLGVLVVEASLRSGSLITARYAADEGREVFAVPGSVDSPLSRGCHALIRDGAKLVESVADVLDEIAGIVGLSGPSVASPAVMSDRSGCSVEGLGASERTLLDAVGHDPVTLDQLVGYTGMTSDRLAPALVALEIDGWIEALPGSRFVRTAGRSR